MILTAFIHWILPVFLRQMSVRIHSRKIMKRIIAFLALCAVSTPLSAQEDLLGNALRMFGLDSMKVGYKPQPAWSTTDRSDPFRLRYFDGLLARPMKIPNFTREMLWRYNVWITGDSIIGQWCPDCVKCDDDLGWSRKWSQLG